MGIKLKHLFFAVITFSVIGLFSTNELVFAGEGDFTIATGFESAIGKNTALKKADTDKEDKKDEKGEKKFKLGKTPVSRQPETPGVQEIGNSNIDGTGLFETGVGIGVLSPQGIFDAGDRTDPIGPGCPAGYVFVDYNGDSILDNGECWRGVVIKDGKLGIGTTVPLFNLDVTGEARITGDLSVLTINGQVPLFTETDPTVPDSVKDGTDWNEISNIPADIADGDQVGILSETDPTVPASIKDGITWTEVSNIPTDIADGDQVGILSETDPTVPASIKDGITWTEISNRPAGLDNGDQIGILSESDPTVANSVKDGVSWPEISGIPSGFADNVDNTGVLAEADPEVGDNVVNTVPKWDGSALVSGDIYNDPSGNIGIGTINPGGALEVSSTTGGFVLPRMNTVQRDALTQVLNGTMIFNTTSGQFEGYNGTEWVTLSLAMNGGGNGGGGGSSGGNNIALQAIAASHVGSVPGPTSLSLTNMRDGVAVNLNAWDWIGSPNGSVGYDFSSTKTVNKIRLYMGINNTGIQNFKVEKWNGSAWIKVPITGWSENASQVNNDEARMAQVTGWATVTFSDTSSTKFRVTGLTFWPGGNGNASGAEFEIYGF